MTEQTTEAARRFAPSVQVAIRQPVHQRLVDLKIEMENKHDRQVTFSEVIANLLDVYREVGG